MSLLISLRCCGWLGAVKLHFFLILAPFQLSGPICDMPTALENDHLALMAIRETNGASFEWVN